jgi:triacylglycerol lipase
VLNLNPCREYDSETALSLAILCDFAYQDHVEGSSQVEDWGFEHVEFVSVEKSPNVDTQVVVLSRDADVVVVFRGTDDPKDWMTSLEFDFAPGPMQDTKVHDGFQSALFPAILKVSAALNIHRSQHKKLWITGHSLGGALCSLYAGMLVEIGLSVDGIYTFASPRPGNGDFAKQLNEKILGPHYRVVNRGDVVPHVPPEPFYQHCGNRVILDGQSEKHDESSWWNERLTALKKIVVFAMDAFDVLDHHALCGDDESYIPRLKAEVQKLKADGVGSKAEELLVHGGDSI